MLEKVYFITEIINLIGGKVLGKIKEDNLLQAKKISECENDNTFDYYFINKKSKCMAINSKGLSKEIKIINNLDKKVLIYVIDVKTKIIYSIANNEKKEILIDAKNSVKIKIEYIDDLDDTTIYASRDQGVTWEYLSLSEI